MRLTSVTSTLMCSAWSEASASSSSDIIVGAKTKRDSPVRDGVGVWVRVGAGPAFLFYMASQHSKLCPLTP